MVGLALLALLFAGLTGWELWQARTETHRRTVASAENLATTVARDTARTIRLFDQSIRSAVEALGVSGIDQVSEAIRRHAIFDGPAFVSYLGVMLVTDAAGHVLMDSGAPQPRFASVSERSYFVEQRNRSDLGLYISPPFRSKIDGEATIGLSRRYEKPGGGFGGVVLGAFRLAYFDDLTAELDLGAGGSLTVVNDDGLVLAAGGTGDNAIGGELRRITHSAAIPPGGVGSFETRATTDHVARLHAFARAEGFGLIVVVTTPLATMYNAWRQNALSSAARRRC